MSAMQTDSLDRLGDWLDVLKLWAVLWTVAGSVVAVASPLASILADSIP